MSDIDQIIAALDRIEKRLNDLEARMLSPKQIALNALSDINVNLGTVSAGEFRAGVGTPGQGFTGTRIVYPGVTYDGEIWTVCGVNNDELMVGFRSSDGRFIADGGRVIIGDSGIECYESTSATSSGRFVTINGLGIEFYSSTDPIRRPELVGSAGDTNVGRKGRCAFYSGDAESASPYLLNNIYYDSTSWNLDDTSVAGCIYSQGDAIAHQWRQAAAGANPVTPAVLMELYSLADPALLPGADTDAGTFNLGNASRYWKGVYYKTLNDQGCIGSFDSGVRLRDGSIVSDVEAIKQIKKHPTLKTPKGAPRIDYKTLPDQVFWPAPIAKEDKYRPHPTKEGHKVLHYKKGDKMGEDGAELTALVSITLGAIKELDKRLEKLEG